VVAAVREVERPGDDCRLGYQRHLVHPGSGEMEVVVGGVVVDLDVVRARVEVRHGLPVEGERDREVRPDRADQLRIDRRPLWDGTGASRHDRDEGGESRQSSECSPHAGSYERRRRADCLTGHTPSDGATDSRPGCADRQRRGQPLTRSATRDAPGADRPRARRRLTEESPPARAEPAAPDLRRARDAPCLDHVALAVRDPGGQGELAACPWARR
jgi:hypothetical protein